MSSQVTKSIKMRNRLPETFLVVALHLILTLFLMAIVCIVIGELRWMK